MRYVGILAVVSAPLVSQPPQFLSNGSAEQRANYERGQAGSFGYHWGDDRPIITTVTKIHVMLSVVGRIARYSIIRA